MTHSSIKTGKLVVGNLSPLVRVADLRRLFSKMGAVIQFRMHRDPILLRPTGSALVEMCDLEVASRCLEKFNGLLYHGKTLQIKMS